MKPLTSRRIPRRRRRRRSGLQSRVSQRRLRRLWLRPRQVTRNRVVRLSNFVEHWLLTDVLSSHVSWDCLRPKLPNACYLLYRALFVLHSWVMLSCLRVSTYNIDQNHTALPCNVTSRSRTFVKNYVSVMAFEAGLAEHLINYCYPLCHCWLV